MVKIKQKKTMNLPQLIEWIWDNRIRNERFIHSDSNPPEYLWVNENSEIEFDEDMILSKSDTFTVEVEEEFTEDTELDLIERFIVNNKTYYTNPQTMSINTCLGAVPDDIITTHFYIENDDRELILVWRDGKLVE